VIAVAAPGESAAALTRWENWQGQYARSRRRSELHVRVVAAFVFGAIIANLVVQLFSRHI